MNINYIFLKSQTEYSESSAPTLYIVSDRELADFLSSKNEAVCISLSSEKELSDFIGYKYFITEGVPYLSHLHKIYCHIKNIPFEIGVGKRITVREESPFDLPEIYEIYNDSECQKYLEPLPLLGSFDEAKRFESVKDGYMLYEYGMWIIELNDTKEIIGRVGFEYLDDSHVYIGYVIKSSFRNKGYAKEAIRIALDYLKETCPDLIPVAKCHKDNIFSVKLAGDFNLEIEKEP